MLGLLRRTFFTNADAYLLVVGERIPLPAPPMSGGGDIGGPVGGGDGTVCAAMMLAARPL